MKRTAGILIGPIEARCSGGVWRARAEVDGQEIWFETADAELHSAPEAFAGALLMPSLTQRRQLVMDAPVCPQWHANVPAVVRLFHEWYRLPEILPKLRTRESAGALPRERTGLCFSGGVDSFFSLLRYQPSVDVLVYVYDYDIPIRGHGRAPRFEPWLRRLADEAGVEAVVIRTNLKRHPAFRDSSWLAVHGACLAAVGHLLSGSIGTLVLSSSYARTNPHPAGTHWELDPLWSSSRMECVHFGDTHSRSAKLRDVAYEPLVREFLRPCWENLEERQNCAQCEKCLRTQLVLLECGQLAHFPVFRHELPLVERIDRLRKITSPDLVGVYEGLLSRGLPPTVERAVADLVRRTQRSAALRRRKDALARLIGGICGVPAPRRPMQST